MGHVERANLKFSKFKEFTFSTLRVLCRASKLVEWIKEFRASLSSNGSSSFVASIIEINLEAVL